MWGRGIEGGVRVGGERRAVLGEERVRRLSPLEHPCSIPSSTSSINKATGRSLRTEFEPRASVNGLAYEDDIREMERKVVLTRGERDARVKSTNRSKSRKETRKIVHAHTYA